ncbi:MAG: DUF1592 domain-containing protein [Myxococcales bacterium]|nr:DUF1592 domain-containing protein [Myxococcales bacterium]MCB9717776.1 DUF1592 domain-containing protein [Myxococcales bacterium]
MPAPTTRFFRLTHQQWENTVQDLFGLPEPTGLSAEFRADPFVGGFLFDNNAMSLEVDQALWQGYQRAAVDVAELVVTDPALVAELAPDTGDEATRAAEFIRSFGLRAYRRPLSDAEVAELQALFEGGKTLYEDTTGFEAGMRLVLEAVLQSPWFLYRAELSQDVDGDIIRLDSYEVASRLSYFLWGSMPDEELLDLAAADQLGDPAVVEEQTRRMLESPKAEAVVERFHHQLLEVEKFTRTAPSPAFYPDAPEDLGELAVQEHDLFMRHTVFDQDGSWRDLLTSTETFVNDDLARIYGVEGSFGDEFTRVDLPASERRGIFTQVGFLVANATSVNPDPIHRGAYLARTIACHTIAAPPDNVPPVPAPEENATNRETVVAHTEAPGTECMGCHKPLINPFGFPFESYDSTGAFRTVDNGQTVDASSTVILGSGSVEVKDALDLAEAMAGDEQVHQCYLEHWMEFAMGRPYEEMDAPLVERLSTESLDDTSVKELLVELTKSRPFLTRSTEEMQ